jgi:hypothetical protein
MTAGMRPESRNFLAPPRRDSVREKAFKDTAFILKF